MQYRELKVPGAWEITPKQIGDPLGVFLEQFRDQAFTAAIGHPSDLQQANCSVSAAGVLHGIHFADALRDSRNVSPAPRALCSMSPTAIAGRMAAAPPRRPSRRRRR